MSRITFLVGLPATGKSTYLKTYDFAFNDEVIVSTDDILCEYATAESLTYDEAFRLYMKAAEVEFFKRIAQAVESDKSIIVDRTNMSYASRARILGKITKPYSKIARVFGKNLTVDEWLRRLDSRPGKTIPIHVLISMNNSFQMPSHEEGFDYIEVVS